MSCSGAVSRSSIRAPRMESTGLEAVQLWTRHDGPRHADAEFVEPSCARAGSFYSYTRLLHHERFFAVLNSKPTSGYMLNLSDTAEF